MDTNTHAHAWHCPHTEALILRPTIYAQICIHIHTHVYKRIHINIHTHMHIYTYIHVRTHTHVHIYTHTHTKCIYERTQARLERRRARGCCRRRKPCTSLSFNTIKPHFAPAMLELHCTHFLRHQHPSTPRSLFPTYPRTVRKNGPLRNCRKIRGKAEVQQSPSRWARTATQNLKPEHDQCDCSRRNKKSMRNNKTPQQPITQSRQRGAQTTSAHLHWCGADAPRSWPTHVAGRKGNCPKRGYIFAIFSGFLVWQVWLWYPHGRPVHHPGTQPYQSCSVYYLLVLVVYTSCFGCVCVCVCSCVYVLLFVCHFSGLVFNLFWFCMHVFVEIDLRVTWCAAVCAPF